MTNLDKMTKAQLIDRVRQLEEIASKPFEGIINFEVNVIDDYAMDRFMTEVKDYLTGKWVFDSFETFYEEL